MAEDNSNRLMSKFSGDVNYIDRLNVWFYHLGYAKLNRNIKQWYDLLMVLGDELYTEMNSGERDDYNRYVNLYAEVEKATKQMARSGQVHPTVMLQLRKLELFLRCVQKDAGLQNKPEDEAWKPYGWEVIGDLDDEPIDLYNREQENNLKDGNAE